MEEKTFIIHARYRDKGQIEMLRIRAATPGGAMEKFHRNFRDYRIVGCDYAD